MLAELVLAATTGWNAHAQLPEEYSAQVMSRYLLEVARPAWSESVPRRTGTCCHGMERPRVAAGAYSTQVMSGCLGCWRAPREARARRGLVLVATGWSAHARLPEAYSVLVAPRCTPLFGVGYIRDGAGQGPGATMAIEHGSAAG